MTLSIVALGGTTKAGSTTELALDVAIAAAQSAGATVTKFSSDFLSALPHYGTEASLASEAGRTWVEAVRAADGLLIASPGYHGSISGLVKNAIDYLEETARDERPYLEGRPVGLIATAYGWQATGSTLTALRSIVHALRGWPTPFGAAINGSARPFADGQCVDAAVGSQLSLVATQLCGFPRQTG